MATYAQNVAAVVGSYKDIKVAVRAPLLSQRRQRRWITLCLLPLMAVHTVCALQIDGNRAKSAVYADIQTAL